MFSRIKQTGGTMTTTGSMTKMAAAIGLAALAAAFAGSPAQAGWGQNGMYGNAPQARPGLGGYGGHPMRPGWVRPYERPVNNVVTVYPRPAPPVYVPSPVVVRQPVYVPTPAPVVKETVYVQRPAPAVVVSTPAPVVAAPVVNNTCNCLVKEYPQPGVVVFKDICTKETATYTNLPQQTTAVLPPPVQ
jgi:hypothetical protein